MITIRDKDNSIIDVEYMYKCNHFNNDFKNSCFKFSYNPDKFGSRNIKNLKCPIYDLVMFRTKESSNFYNPTCISGIININWTENLILRKYLNEYFKEV